MFTNSYMSIFFHKACDENVTLPAGLTLWYITNLRKSKSKGDPWLQEPSGSTAAAPGEP